MTTSNTPSFTVHAPALRDGKFTLSNMLSEAYGFGCKGGNRSPALAWEHAPSGTRSFVVTLFDKDAPTGFGWVHWVVANIPATVTTLSEGVAGDGQGLPTGAMQTRTDFGVPGYVGPCPPEGEVHRYEITVLALSVDALPEPVTADATPAMVGFFARAHCLGEATLVVEQGR